MNKEETILKERRQRRKGRISIWIPLSHREEVGRVVGVQPRYEGER